MKSIELKTLGNGLDKFNVYKNTCTFGKVFQLGIKREKLTNEFVKNYISEVKKDYAYHHYLIGIKIDFIINELNFLLENIFQRTLNKLEGSLYGQRFPKYVENLKKVYPFIKDNII